MLRIKNKYYFIKNLKQNKNLLENKKIDIY